MNDLTREQPGEPPRAGQGEVVVPATGIVTKDAEPSSEAPVPRSGARKLIAWLGVAFGILYLLNPTFGFFEFIPDNFPLVGNLDEAGAAALVLFGLRSLGLDLFPGKTDR